MRVAKRARGKVSSARKPAESVRGMGDPHGDRRKVALTLWEADLMAMLSRGRMSGVGISDGLVRSSREDECSNLHGRLRSLMRLGYVISLSGVGVAAGHSGVDARIRWYQLTEQGEAALKDWVERARAVALLVEGESDVLEAVSG